MRQSFPQALRLLDQDPLHGAAHRAAIRAYCRWANVWRAMAQYGRCQQTLQAELGVEPMAETLALPRGNRRRQV